MIFYFYRIVFLAIVCMLIFGGFVYVLYRYHLRLKSGMAALLALAGAVFAIVAMVFYGHRLDEQAAHGELAVGVPIVAVGIMCLLGLDLAAKLYLTWVCGNLTEGEATRGAKGFRAWLSFFNLLVVLGIAACGWAALEWNFGAALAGGMLLILAYPTVNTLSWERTGGSGETDIGEERRRVLALVEAGKVSGEDGAELIGALGQSHVVARDEGAALSGARRVMLLGAALVLVGFFMPWFDVNVRDQVAQLTSQMSRGMESMAERDGMPPTRVPGLTMVPVHVIVRGGDVAHGLGWMILAAGMGAAVLTIIWPTRRDNRAAQKGVTLIALGVGTVMVIYLLSEAMSAASAGMGLVAGGYAVLWIGAVREYVYGGRMRVGGVVAG